MPAQILCVCFLVSALGFADEPKPAKQTIERNIRIGSAGEQLTIKFDNAKAPNERIAGIQVAVDGKKLKQLQAGGEAVAELKAYPSEKDEAGTDRVRVEVSPNWKGIRTYELTPILNSGKEGPVTYKLKIQAGN